MENNNNKMKLKDIILPPISGEWGNDDEEGNGVLVLRTTNFTNEGIINYENIITRKINKKNINHKYLQKGDILIEKSGGSEKQPVGRVVYFEGEEYKYLFNNFTSVLRIKNKNFINSKYLFLYLYSYYKNGGTLAFQNKTTGLHNLKLEQFVASIEIPVLSLSEQQRIANELDKVCELIDKRQTQLQKLDLLIKSKFVEMFGDPNGQEKRFIKVTLTNVCTFIDGDRGKNYPKQEEFKKSGYCLFLNAKNVTSDGFSFKECYFISREKDDILKKGRLTKGDIVLTTRGTIGNLAFYDETIPYENIRINSGMLIIQIDKTKLNEKFFINQFKFLLEKIKRENVSGSAQPQLPVFTMKKIFILLPPLELQNLFVDFVDKVEKNKTKIKASLDKLITLKKALMQKYFG